MALEDMLTLPLKLASETLAQQTQPQADPQGFARQVDQNNFNEKAPDFFRQAAAAIAAQAAQTAAVSAGGGGGGGGGASGYDPEDYDHAAYARDASAYNAAQRNAANEAIAANVPAGGTDGTPYYLQKPEEAARPTSGGRGLLHGIGTVIGDVLDEPGQVARGIGSALASVGDVVGDTGLPGSGMARRILHVPDAAETGFLEGWKKQHGTDFSAFEAIKGTEHNLEVGQQWMNERMNYLTGHSIDPIINNTIGDFSPGTARWMTAAVDRLGELVPFILLNIVSGGGATATKIPSGLTASQRIIQESLVFMKTPVGKSFLAQGAAQLAGDTQAYSEGKITGGQFVAAAGVNIGANIGPDIGGAFFSEIMRNIKSPAIRNQLMKDIAEASGKAEGLGPEARGIRSAEHLAESMPSTEEAAAQKFGEDANLTRQERMDRAAAQLGPDAPPSGIGIPAKGAGQEAAPLPDYSVRQPEAGVTVKETKAATKTITETAQTPTDRMSDRHTLTTDGGDRLDYRGTHINDVTVVREGKGTGTALLTHAVEAIRERNPEAVITADLNSPSGAALFAKQPGAEFFDRAGNPITVEQALKLAEEKAGPTVALHANTEQVPTPIRAEETLADVHAMRAKARTSNPEELQRLARNEGLTRTHEELAHDRGEVGAAPKPVREERKPTPMRKREPSVAAGEAGALRAKGTASLGKLTTAVKNTLSPQGKTRSNGFRQLGVLMDELGISNTSRGYTAVEAAYNGRVELTPQEIALAYTGDAAAIKAIEHKALLAGQKVVPVKPGSEDYRYISLESVRQQRSGSRERTTNRIDAFSGPIETAISEGKIIHNPTVAELAATPTAGDIGDTQTLRWIIQKAQPSDAAFVEPYVQEAIRRSNAPMPPEVIASHKSVAIHDDNVARAWEFVKENRDKYPFESDEDILARSGLLSPAESKAEMAALRDKVTPEMQKQWEEAETADRIVQLWNDRVLSEYAEFRSKTGRPIQWADNRLSKRHFELRAAYEDAINIGQDRAKIALDRLDNFLRGGEDGMLRVSVYGDTIRKWFSNMGPVVERIMKAVIRVGRTFHNNELGALMRKGSLPKFGDLKVEDILDFGGSRLWLHPEESHGQWAKHMVQRIGGTEDFWHNHLAATVKHVEEKYGLLGKGRIGLLADGKGEFGPEAGPRAYDDLMALYKRGRKVKGDNGETIDMSKWYDNFWKTMVTHFGDDAETVTKLAAMSQMNAAPSAGIPQIIRGYLQWKMGEPISAMSNANIRKQMESILMGGNPEGPKIQPFYEALRYTNRVGRNAVAIDRWMIGAIGAKAEGSGMLVSKLQGNEKFIHFSQALIKMAADEAGVDPRAFQAGIWGGFRESWDEMLKAAGGKPQGGDNNFFENILLKTMKQYDMRSPEGFTLNSLKSIEAQLTDKNSALAEVEYWQRTLQIEDVNEKMYAVDYNQKLAAANFLDTGKMPEHIRMGETKDEIAKIAQEYKSAFETRVGMASDETLRDLKTIPKWQKEIVDGVLDQRARAGEQVDIAWKALPEKETMRLNTLGWMRIPETPVAQAGVVRALKQLESVQTKEDFLKWANRKGNKEIVGDPMAFVGENIPTGVVYGTGKKQYRQMATSDYWNEQPFYENRQQMNMQGIKDAITRRFQNPPEYARNLADTLGLHDGKVGEEASILGQCGVSAAKSIF